MSSNPADVLLIGEQLGSMATADSEQALAPLPIANHDDVVIRVTGLSKCYQIYERPQDRLKQSIVPRLQRLVRQVPRSYYREFWALRDVSLEVRKGETVGIIGRNGAGKSTLLQILCGTLFPTAGTIEVKGRVAALLELGSGFNPEFSGRENIYLSATLLGLSQAEIDERYDDILAFADIGLFIEQPLKTYSSGMAVRLAFAVYAVIDPDIFIVDEALAVGDEKFQRKCFARLAELKSRGSAIVFVSHSAPSIIELCDKTLLLDHGARVILGPAPDVVRAYQRIIYAAPEAQEQLIREYLAIDRSGEIARTALETDQQTAADTPGKSFEENLKPETTLVYPERGAAIELIQILDPRGEAVNVLQPGKNYQFAMSGRFTADCEGVYFGIHIRSVSGLVITGQVHPEQGNCIRHVRSGATFRTNFWFDMILLPGVYFAGGGIWSEHEPHCLHRIVDALMFRVLPDGRLSSFGYVDASVGNAPSEVIWGRGDERT